MTVWTHFSLLLLQACFVAVVQFDKVSVKVTADPSYNGTAEPVYNGTAEPVYNGTAEPVDINSRHDIPTEYTIAGPRTPTITSMGERLPREAAASSPTSDPYTLQNMFDDDPCNTYGTCAFVNTSEFKYCHCDEQCHAYHDCCFDSLTENTTRDTTFDCLDSDSVDLTLAGYFVIAKCLNETFRPELYAKCENNDILLNGPWVYGNDGNIYKNKHCAECNGLTTFEPFSLRFYNVPSVYVNEHFNKTQEERFTILLNQSKNGISYRQIYYRWQSPVALDTRTRCLMVAPMTNTSSGNCQMYAYNPIFVPQDKTAYRNIYCAPTQQTNPICVNIFIKVITLEWLFDIFPLNIMFSFVQKTSDHSCDKQVDSLCRTDELYKNMEVEKRFAMVSHANISNSLLKKIILNLAWSLVDSPNVTRLQYLVAYQDERENDSSIVITNIFAKYIIQKGFDSMNIMNRVRKIENANLRIRIQFNTSNVLDMFTIPTLYQSTKEFTERSAFLSFMFLADDDTVLFISNQFNNIQTDVDHPFCDYVTVDTTYDDEEDVLLISQVRCENYITDPHLSITPDKVGAIITYTGTALSIILLMISVMMNRKAGLTRSVPGGNVQNLSVSLIIANILFVTGIGANDYQMVCLVLGVLLHYFWLLFFSFMSVTIVYMFRNIRGIIVNNTGIRHDSFTKKVKLTTLGIALPLVIVVPSCVLEYLGTTQFTPHYAGKICFPTSYPGNFLFVTGPIMISIAVNIFCLVMIITFLYQHKEQTKHIQKSQSYQQLPVYLRMSVLTGCFWMIGIIGTVFNSEVINYIFIVICSLQGMMIAVSNLTTSKIRKELQCKTRQDDM